MAAAKPAPSVYFLNKWKSQQSPPLPKVSVRVNPIFKFPAGYVVNVAKQPLLLFAFVFHICRVPKTFSDGSIKVILAVRLCALLQIGGMHDLKKYTAVNFIKTRYRFHSGRRRMLFHRFLVDYIFAHRAVYVLLRKPPSFKSALYSAIRGGWSEPASSYDFVICFRCY